MKLKYTLAAMAVTTLAANAATMTFGDVDAVADWSGAAIASDQGNGTLITVMAHTRGRPTSKLTKGYFRM